MSSSHSAPAASPVQPVVADDFGTGILDETPPKRPTPVAAPVAAQKPPPLPPAPANKPADEDDGFGAGLL